LGRQPELRRDGGPDGLSRNGVEHGGFEPIDLPARALEPHQWLVGKCQFAFRYGVDAEVEFLVLQIIEIGLGEYALVAAWNLDCGERGGVLVGEFPVVQPLEERTQTGNHEIRHLEGLALGAPEAVVDELAEKNLGGAFTLHVPCVKIRLPHGEGIHVDEDGGRLAEQRIVSHDCLNYSLYWFFSHGAAHDQVGKAFPGPMNSGLWQVPFAFAGSMVARLANAGAGW
jgi:hypothetical protein